MVARNNDMAEVRSAYAGEMASASGSADPRLERAFDLVPRELFAGPPPWRIIDVRQQAEETTDDPRRLYRDVLVALDEAKGINNGEPYLHAAWIGRIAPKAGERVTHIGAGTGYYSAILGVLVLPDGKVRAIEIEPRLAEMARIALEAFPDVEVVEGDATVLPLSPSDIVYVNAGLAAPPVHWLKALDPGGRMIFPWRPADNVAFAALVTRKPDGYAFEVLMPSWFIPLTGAPFAGRAGKVPSAAEARETRSIWLKDERPPDDTATAVVGDVWFSSARLPEDGSAAGG